MVISDIRLVAGDDTCEIQARVTSDTGRFESFLLWYRFPAALHPSLPAGDADPFVPALLPAAMVMGEPLIIEAPVSSRLLDTHPRIQGILRGWYPRLAEVPVEAARRPAEPDGDGNPSGRGLFFSAGVDSFYSLVRNQRDHPADEESITHLIVVHGFDVYVGRGNDSLFPAVLANTEKVAHALGKSILPVATNLRDLTDRFADWGVLQFGPAMASVGLTLSGVLSKVFIAGWGTFAQQIPAGSHPDLDPLWSTEHVTFVHDGCEATRTERLRLLAQFPIALETLRVCWQNPDNEYNCGRCEKCLRTMVGLHIAGALPQCRTLSHVIDLDRLRSVSTSGLGQRTLWEELAANLGSAKEDIALKAAIRQALARDHGTRWKRGVKRVSSRLRRSLAALAPRPGS